MVMTAAAVAALVMGGANLVKDIVGGLVKAGRRDEAMQVLRSADIPPIEKMTYEAMILNDPEQFIAMTQGRTEMDQISTDPRLAGAETQALQQLQDIQEGGGYTASERGDISKIATDMGTALRGQREAGLAQAQSRGLGGSGLRLASDIANRQAAAGRASQQGFDVAKAGALRQLQAGQGAGDLASRLQAKSFGQQGQQRSAQDAINRFNTGNQNQAGMFNIQNQQRTDMANQAATNTQRQAQAQAEMARARMEQERAAAEAQMRMS